jgi:DNA mismatch repair protein MutS2
MRKDSRAVQEELVTFRNGRFVIPIRTDSRGQVPGVVHGLSSSGQTTFVEPLVVIEQNNELVRLREQEEIEIARILLAITGHLRENLPGIRAIAEVVAALDFDQAKGRLSIQFHCVRPRLSESRRLVLVEGRHILLEHALRNSGSDVVPISMEMDEAHQVLVISGPNAGGKTIVVKTAGLVALMAQMGLHVPAREAVLPIFDQVFADIGDQQSIAANLSTFTAHMRNIAEMEQQVAPPSLILLDEVGTGTDPDEGAALAEAIVDFFRRAGATTIATTHYNPLKMWAARTEGVLNASVEFDEKTLRPTFRLIMGIAGASSGLEIARRMNVRASILDQAATLVEPSQARASEYLKRLKDLVLEQETLRNALEEERAATAAEYARLDLLFAKREGERKAEFEQAMARAVQMFGEESQRLLHGIKDKIEAARLKKVAEIRSAELRRTAERLRKETVRPGSQTSGTGQTQLAPADATRGIQVGELREGDRVRVRTLNKEGVVDSIRNEIITVSVGAMKFRATLSDLEAGDSQTAPDPVAENPRRPGVSGPNLDEQFVPELNVIGMTADEATDRVDKFLDEAFYAGTEAVRIIHGHGKGILRRAIATLLTGHPQVEKFQLAPPNQGGAGATLVDLKK